MPKLSIVGAGTPTPTATRWGTCFILDICGQRLMVDCGPASTYKMHRMGIGCTAVSDLFFTHLHSDHISDYICFLMTRFDQCVGTERNLHVYGPQPIREITETIWSPNRGVFWYDVIARVNHPMSVHAFHMRGGEGERPLPVVHVKEYSDGKVAEGDGWVCYAREVKHAQPWIDCYGFRFETDEGVVSFSGDTAPIDSVLELARDADLFVMEAVHREEKIQTFPSVISETGTLNAGRMATEAGARRLVINHQSPYLEDHTETNLGIADIVSVYDGPIYWARDMMVVDW